MKDVSRLLDWCINQAWEFAYSFLYPSEFFSANNIATDKVFLRQYFTPASNSKNPQFASIYRQFVERLAIANRWVMNDPYRFFPQTQKYFDQLFKDGFTGTKKLYQTDLDKRKIEKDSCINNAIFAKLYAEYTNNPRIETFNKISQTLAKREDQIFLDMFCQCVIELEDYDKNLLSKMKVRNQENGMGKNGA